LLGPGVRESDESLVAGDVVERFGRARNAVNGLVGFPEAVAEIVIVGSFTTLGVFEIVLLAVRVVSEIMVFSIGGTPIPGIVRTYFTGG
jgi:hypothetical protein